MCATATGYGDSTICIDGGKFEGGGQILRIAVSLAAILGKGVKVHSIRAGRPKPGLGNQHIAGLKLAQSLTKGKMSSCEVGTSEITFMPGSISCGDYDADAKTAGSVSLLLQIATPILLFSPGDCHLILKGGTDAKFAPPIDYMSEVTLHYFQMMGADYHIKVNRRGFYPLGGGVVESKFTPLKVPVSPLTLLDIGTVTLISGYAFVAGRVPSKVAQEMKDEAVHNFRRVFPSCSINIDVFKESDDRCQGNIGTFMFIIHTSTNCRLAASGISDPRGPHHRQLVSEACEKLMQYLTMGACCDENMQDQLIVPMALAKGKSQIRCGPLTLHTKTAIYVTEIMLPVKFDITELENGSTIISCEGVGLCPKPN